MDTKHIRAVYDAHKKVLEKLEEVHTIEQMAQPTGLDEALIAYGHAQQVYHSRRKLFLAD